jgi:uncharacterized protein YyaL (SSP411 family)
VPNRLASEQSPYLLQHKDNPVDWYPWGEEAFARARAEQKPIFLSIGYSTCHWCHVMEHESFEDAAIAEVLNREFVAIKVDREERPDVDRVYMTFVQATTGSGGWPMSVWLTPALAPFYGGTYYPPTSRWGRPGFIDVLREIARAWREEREKVLQSSAAILGRLRSIGAVSAQPDVPGVDVLDRAVVEFASVFDARRGGFGDAPKFPRPSELLFLLREHARTGKAAPRDMALVTLRAMALGGMRDHIGGGFHRYSVDGDWRVPHFEKMLYDQAQLVLAYLEAAQVSGDAFYAEVAADTLAYVRRDLADPGGGFYSAEDADSVPPEEAGAARPHKVEGAFYVWRAAEIDELLGDEAPLFRERCGIRPDGNAPADPQGEFTGRNLLYTARSLDDLDEAAGRTRGEVEAALAAARQTLFARRLERPRPHRDDKVLTAWNGLMIAAFARAGRVLESGASWVADARRAALFVREHLWNAGTGTLRRRYRQGHAAVDGYAEDYAFLIFGLLELFQTDGDASWLDWAQTLQRRQDDLFWDEANGGWFSTTGDDETVLLRLKEDYDGAEPAASSVGVLNLLTLSHLTADADLAARAARTLRLFGGRAGQNSRTVPMALAALSTYHMGTPQIVLAGERPEDVHPLRDVLRRRYLPAAVSLTLTSGQRDAVARLLPWTATMLPRDGRAAAYVCREFTCLAPVTSGEALAGELDKMTP